MKKWMPTWIAAALIALGMFMTNGCNLADGGDSDLGDTVFTCDASKTVAEFCLEEAGGFSNQQASKTTCNSVPGSTWSDAKRCPGSYEKKCKDGDKLKYFYADGDGSKECTQLVLSLAAAETLLASGRCTEPHALERLLGLAPISL